MRTHTTIDSPIGPLTLVATDGVLSAIYMAEHLHQPDPGTFGELAPGGSAAATDGFAEATRQLREYFDGERHDFDLELAPRGTPFQQRVWAALRTIPYGRTKSYGQLAREIGLPHMTRAVGSATGRNPLSIVIPCHRLVGADGSLTGYAGGLPRKRYLLDLEAGRLTLTGQAVPA